MNTIVFPLLHHTHAPCLTCLSTPSKEEPHQLVSLVLVEKQRLFEWLSDVSVRGHSLEICGCKLGEFILRQVLLFVSR